MRRGGGAELLLQLRTGWIAAGWIAACLLAIGCGASRPAPPPAGAQAGRPAARGPLLEVDASHLRRAERACLADLVRAGAALPRDATAPRGAWTNTAMVQTAGARGAIAGDTPTLASYLAGVEVALTSSSLLGLEEQRQAVRGTRLLVLFGPATPAELPIRSLEVGLAAADDQLWLDAWLERAAEFQRWLGVPAERVTEVPGTWRIADLCLRAGTLGGSASGSTALPLDASFEPTLGPGRVFWRNMILERWYPQEVQPTVEVTIARGQTGFATARSLLGFYALRFPAGRLPGSVVPGVDGEPVQARHWFGDDWAPLAIAKSDLLGTLAEVWLAREGLRPAQLEREALTLLVVLAFRAAADVQRGLAPPPHAPASFAILNALLEAGALESGVGGTWELDFERTEQTVRELALQLLAIFAAGDRTGARAFVATGASLAPPLRETLDGVLRVRLTIAAPRVRAVGI